MSRLFNSLLLFVVLLGLAGPAAAQSTSRDRLNGSVLVNGVKPPVVVATTIPIVLSGQQTIDGVAITQGERVLVKNQTDATTNGIYVASLGAWARSQDFDGPGDVMAGVLVTVFEGTQAGLWQLTTADPITIGGQTPSNLTFVTFSAASSVSVANAVNVMQSPYGAKCDGVTNDNTAFTAALATGKCVYIPPTANGCALNNLTVSSDSCMVGISAPQYATMLTASRIVNVSGASKVLNVNGASNITLANFDTFCGGTLASPSSTTTVTGISGGSTNLFASEIGVHYCGNGGLGDTSNITSFFHSNNSVYYGSGNQNTTGGLVNLVDSKSSSDTLSANYYGATLPTGANENTFIGDKIEWNNAFGINCFFCKHLAVSGGVSDSNQWGAISFDHASPGSVSGGEYERNGWANTYGHNQDFYFNGSSAGISITGISTDHGKHDDNTGPDAPAYVAFFNTNTDTNLNMQNNNFCGYTTAPIGYNASTISSGIISHNLCATPKYVGNDATATAYSAAELTALGAGAGGSGTVNAGTTPNLAYYATSTTAVSPAPKTSIVNGDLTLGTANTTQGSISFFGSTSGSAKVSTAAAAGTSTLFQLPSSNGVNGQALTTDGSGHTSWAAPGSGALVLLGTVNASNAATVSFGSSLITGTYNCYKLIADSIVPVTNGATLMLQVSPDNGSTIENSSYQWGASGGNSSGGYYLNNASDSSINLSGGRGVYNTSTLTGSVEVDFCKPSGTNITTFRWQSATFDSTGGGNTLQNLSGAGAWNTTGALNYILLKFSSGNVSTMNAHLYGVVGS